MPPKPKYTKEQIAQMAYDIVRTSGPSKLTARELGKYMGTSPTPIFSVFEDMEELNTQVIAKAKNCFESYIALPGSAPKAYESRIYQCVKFAAEEPELFKMLFVSEKDNNAGFEYGCTKLNEFMDYDADMLSSDSGMSKETAGEVIARTYINAYAYCTLVALGCCPITMDVIRTRIKDSLSGVSTAF